MRSRNTTYVANSPPAPKANDLNEIQDAHVDAYWRRPLVCDDFTGDSLNRGQWANISATAPGVASFVDDSANGAFGCYKFDGSAGLGGTGISLYTNAIMPFGTTRDFYMRWVGRLTNFDANSICRVGFGAVLGFLHLGSADATNWRVYVNGVSTATNTATVALNTAYKLFEIERVDAVTSWYIDNVLVHEETGALTTGTTVGMQNVQNASSTLIMWNDSFECYASHI
jgi:hypothetical protein